MRRTYVPGCVGDFACNAGSLLSPQPVTSPEAEVAGEPEGGVAATLSTVKAPPRKAPEARGTSYSNVPLPTRPGARSPKRGEYWRPPSPTFAFRQPGASPSPFMLTCRPRLDQLRVSRS